MADYIISGSAVSTGSFGHGYFNSKVGIGETSPDELLHIKSAVDAKPVIKLENSGNNSNSPQLVFFNSSTANDNDITGTIRLKLNNDASEETEYATIYGRAIDVSNGTEDGELHFRTINGGNLNTTMLLQSGNVGIGTTNPGAKLHINGGAWNTSLIIQSNAGSGGIKFLDSDNNFDGAVYAVSSMIGFLDPGGDWMLKAVNDSHISFHTNGATEHMRITSTGNVGIGTNNPDGTLHVHTATAGSITANTTYDDLVIENSTHAGISILTPNNAHGGILFGDPQDDDIGNIKYDHSTNKLMFTAAATSNPGFSMTSNTVEFGADILKVSGSLTSTGSFGRIYAGGNIVFNGASNKIYTYHLNNANYIDAKNFQANTSSDINFQNAVGPANIVSVGNVVRLKSKGSTPLVASGSFIGIGIATPTHTLHSISTDNKGFFFYKNLGNNADTLNEFSSYYSLSILNRNAGSYLNFGGDANRTDIQATDGAGSATAKILALNPFGGNVGIGVTNPDDYNEYGHRLVVKDSVNAGISIISDTNGDGSLYFGDGTGAATYRGWLGYNHANDSMSVGTAAAERIRITNGGNVGIGGTTPGAKLEVYGDGAALNQIRLRHNGSGTNGVLDLSATSTAANIIANYSSTAIPLRFFTGAAEKMQISATGKVGIGETSPDKELHLKASEPTFRIEQTAEANKYFDMQVNTGGGTSRLKFSSEAQSNTLVISNNARVGINQVSAAEALDVVGNSLISGNLTVGGNLTAKQLIVSSSVTNMTVAQASGSTKFGDTVSLDTHQFSGSLKVTGSITLNGSAVTSGGGGGSSVWSEASSEAYYTGRVGIGTNNPDNSRRLHIRNTDDTRGILIENTSATSYSELHLKANREYRIGTGGSSAAAAAVDRFYIYDATAAAHRFTIMSSGNVGIGSTTPGYPLDVNGVIASTAAVGVFRLVGTSSGRVYDIKSNAGRFEIRDVDNGQDRLIVGTNGNVGIGDGLLTPAGKLDVRGTVTASMFHANASADAGSPEYSFGTDPDTGMYWGGANVLAFSTAGTVRFTLNSSALSSQVTGGARMVPANGSAAAATFTFNDDPDTGMYRAGANDIGFTTGGTERFRIDSSGNLIIRANDKHLYGLTSGNATIQLIGVRGDNYVEIGHSGYGVVTGTGNWALDGSDNMTVNANAYFAQYLYHSGDTDTYMQFLDDRLLLYAGGDEILDYEEGASSILQIANGGEADISIGGGNMFIGGSQGSYDAKVGIGNSSPGSTLDVTGEVRGQKYAFNDDTNTHIDTFAADQIGFTLGGNSAVRWAFVAGAVTQQFMYGASATYPSYTFQSDQDTGMFNATSNTIGFSTGGSEKMRIDASGNVGIGNSSPDVKLHVNGIIRSYGGSGGVHIYGAGMFYLENSNRIQWGNTVRIESNGQGTVRVYGHTDATKGEVQYGNGGAYIAANGANLGVGTRTASTTLAVNGSFSATSKSFLIDHPTKEGKKLQYGSLEGPENGVYVRGKFQGGKYQDNIIDLPDYWVGLVDEDTITINLTPVGKFQQLYVEDIKDNQIFIKSADDSEIKCFYTIYGERKDIEKLEVEF